jgi:tetratricopeptide (TPR) repeat protein
MGKYQNVIKLLNNSYDKITNKNSFLKATEIINITYNSLKPMPKKLKDAYTKWLSVAQTGKNLQAVLSVSKEGMRDYPEYSEMYTLAGLAAYLLDNKSQAVEYFTKAIKIAPNQPFNYIQMGVIFWNLKRYLKSIDYFKKALSLNKYLPTVYNYLTLFEKNNKNYDKAIKYKKQELRFNETLELEMDLALLYKESNQDENLKILLEDLIKKYPDSKKPYKELVTLYDKLIEKETNPKVKIKLKQEQLLYMKLYHKKDEEESKKRLIKAEIENNGKTTK